MEFEVSNGQFEARKQLVTLRLVMEKVDHKN